MYELVRDKRDRRNGNQKQKTRHANMYIKNKETSKKEEKRKKQNNLHVVCCDFLVLCYFISLLLITFMYCVTKLLRMCVSLLKRFIILHHLTFLFIYYFPHPRMPPSSFSSPSLPCILSLACCFLLNLGNGLQKCPSMCLLPPIQVVFFEVR